MRCICAAPSPCPANTTPYPTITPFPVSPAPTSSTPTPTPTPPPPTPTPTPTPAPTGSPGCYPDGSYCGAASNCPPPGVPPNNCSNCCSGSNNTLKMWCSAIHGYIPNYFCGPPTGTCTASMCGVTGCFMAVVASSDPACPAKIGAYSYSGSDAPGYSGAGVCCCLEQPCVGGNCLLGSCP